MKVDDKLIKKYSKTGPRYTSYPPATFLTQILLMMISKRK